MLPLRLAVTFMYEDMALSFQNFSFRSWIYNISSFENSFITYLYAKTSLKCINVLDYIMGDLLFGILANKICVLNIKRLNFHQEECTIYKALEKRIFF